MIALLDVATTCPWCGSHQQPMNTAEHLDLAEFQYSDPRDPKVVARNPVMCSECYGVGGFKDFIDG